MIDVRWFTGRTCVGIVRVETEYEGVHFYIGAPQGRDEAEDIQWIADWGARFPREVGELLFGEDAIRNGSAVPIPLNKEQAECMIKVGQMYLGVENEKVAF
jgi:hypothetical protein